MCGLPFPPDLEPTNLPTKHLRTQLILFPLKLFVWQLLWPGLGEGAVTCSEPAIPRLRWPPLLLLLLHPKACVVEVAHKAAAQGWPGKEKPGKGGEATSACLGEVTLSLSRKKVKYMTFKFYRVCLGKICIFFSKGSKWVLITVDQLLRFYLCS